MISLVDAGEGGETLEGREDDNGAAAGRGSGRVMEHLAHGGFTLRGVPTGRGGVALDAEPSEGDGWAGAVAEEALSAGGVGARDADGGVEAEAASALPGEHVGHGVVVEEAASLEEAEHAALEGVEDLSTIVLRNLSPALRVLVRDPMHVTVPNRGSGGATLTPIQAGAMPHTRRDIPRAVPGTPRLFRAVGALLIGFAVAACSDDVTAPIEEPDPDPPPFVVGDVEGPGVAVSTPYSASLTFQVVSETDERVDKEVALDLNESGEPNVVITRMRLVEDGRQLVTVRSRPGTWVAVAPGVEAPVDDDFSESSATFRAPSVPPPGTILDRGSLIWAENEPLFAAYVIRNMIWTPSGFRLLGESNHLVFRIGERLGWVELGMVVDRVLQVEAVEVRRIGLRVDPERG